MSIIRLVVVLAIGVIMVSGGCRSSERSKTPTTTKATGRWTPMHPVTFKKGGWPKPATPTTRQVEGELTLEQIMNEVAATPRQRAEATEVVQMTRSEWQEWVNINMPRQKERLDQATAAARAADERKLEQVTSDFTACVKQLPFSKATWQSILKSFDDEQRQKLDHFRDAGLKTVSRQLHRSAMDIVLRHSDDVTACKFCHMPHHPAGG